MGPAQKAILIVSSESNISRFLNKIFSSELSNRQYETTRGFPFTVKIFEISCWIHIKI